MLKTLFWLLLAINGILFALGQGVFGQRASQRTEPQRLAQQLNPGQLVLASPAIAAPVVPAVPVIPPLPAIASAPQSTVTSAPVPAAVAAPATTPISAAPAVAKPAATTPMPAPAPATLSPAAASVPTPAAEPMLACVDIGNFDPNEARSFRTRLTAAKLSVQPTQRSVQEVASYMVYIAAEGGRDGAEHKAAELRRLGLTDFYIMPDSSPMRDAVSLGLFKTEAAAKAYVGQLIPQGVRSARIVERTASTNKVAFRLRNLTGADQAGFAALVAAFPNQSRRDCSG